MGGMFKSFGIFYVEYLDLYNQGPIKTAWIISSFSIAYVLPGNLNARQLAWGNVESNNVIGVIWASLEENAKHSDACFHPFQKGLVTGFISDHYDTRMLNMVLAVLCSLSFAMAAFAPNLTVTILTAGVFAGRQELITNTKCTILHYVSHPAPCKSK